LSAYKLLKFLKSERMPRLLNFKKMGRSVAYPTSASWLNQVEIWFGVLSRKAFRNASFENLEHLKKSN